MKTSLHEVVDSGNRLQALSAEDELATSGDSPILDPAFGVRTSDTPCI